MSDSEDYETDDVQSAQQAQGRKATAGTRAIDRMMQNAAKYREQARVAVDTLTDVHLNPKTEANREYWFKLYSAFAEHVLQVGQRPE